VILEAIGSLIVLGQVLLPGSALSLEQAKQEAHSIVVAEVINTGDLLGAPEASMLTWTGLKPSVFVKGPASEKELNRLPLSVIAQGKERLPRVGDEFIFFIGNDQGRAPITKVLPNTAENLAAIRTARSYRRDLSGGGLGGG